MHPNECQCRLGALFHACRGMVNRAPLLLPLMVVCGVICSGGVGWSVAGVALVIGCVLGAYRVTLCAFFCGMVVALCAALRQREMDPLKLTDQPPPRIVQVQGTVIRTLNHGCIVESGVLGVRVVVYGDISAQLGESLSVEGELKQPEQPLVPGMFSQEEWMRGMGIVARLNCLRMECSNGDFGYATLLRAAERVRMVLVNRLMPSGTEKDVRRQVLCALVLGEKGRADDDTIDIFRRGGCLHAFAVSGLHVGIVASILWVLLRLCHLRPDWGRWVLIFGVGLYVFATGMAVPALRAYIMLSMVLGALMLRRRISFLNAWCYAALLVLMFQPWQFYQPGFRLSFMVYGAICLGVRYAMSNLPWFGPDSYIPVRIHTRWERRYQYPHGTATATSYVYGAASFGGGWRAAYRWISADRSTLQCRVARIVGEPVCFDPRSLSSLCAAGGGRRVDGSASQLWQECVCLGQSGHSGGGCAW